MAKFKIPLNISDVNLDVQTIEGLIIGELNNRFRLKALRRVEQEVISIVEFSLLNSPTIEALQFGKLRAELGLTNELINAFIPVFIEKVKETINVKFDRFTKRSGGIASTLRISILDDVNKVLNLEGAEYVSEQSQSVIRWLRWLLVEGTTPIVLNYFVVYKPWKTSRTGLAFMAPGKQKSFSVDPVHAGTPEDNFVTRAFQGFGDELKAVLEEELSRL